MRMWRYAAAVLPVLSFPPGRMALLAVSLMLLSAVSAPAQQRVDLAQRATSIIRALPPIDFSKYGAPTPHGRMERGLNPVATALGLAPDEGEGLGVLRKVENAETGLSTLHADQRAYGLPVWGSDITLTARPGESPRRVSGIILRGLARDIARQRPRFSAEKARRIALRASGIAVDPPQQTPFATEAERAGPGLVIHAPPGGRPRLAWEVVLEGSWGGRPVRPHMLIDAMNGDVLLEYDDLKSLSARGIGGNAKTGCYRYGGDGLPALLVRRLKNGMCALDNEFVTTWNCGQQSELKKCRIHVFPCPESIEPERINGGCSPVNDAHFFGYVTYQLYESWYGLSPIGKKLNMLVHYRKNMENAYWEDRYQAMFFGDGKAQFYPLVSLDVTAHEISHGFTSRHSALIYREQSGSINEAFSDMAGETAEYFFRVRYMKNAKGSPGPVAEGKRPVPGRRPPPAPPSRPAPPRRAGVNPNEVLRSVPPPWGGGGDAGRVNALLTGGAPASRSGAAGEGAGAYAPPSARPPGRETPGNAADDGQNPGSGRAVSEIFRREMPDYRVGADITRKRPAMRYFANPEKDGSSIGDARQYPALTQKCRRLAGGRERQTQSCIVHLASGVYNRAFYLLSVTPGWNPRKAFRVFLLANRQYWGKSETFRSAAVKVIEAAGDLKMDKAAVRAAFRRVGVLD